MENAQLKTKTFEINLTDKAVEKVKGLIKEAKKEDSFLRISVSGGCCGSSETLSFDNKLADTDKSVDVNGVKIVVAEAFADKLNGLKIDYAESEGGSGFVTSNPNTAAKGCGSGGCGCGSGGCGTC